MKNLKVLILLFVGKKQIQKGIWFSGQLFQTLEDLLISIIQEASIEGDEILLLRNGVVAFSSPMDKPRFFNRFTIGSNGNGAGSVDWIAVR